MENLEELWQAVIKNLDDSLSTTAINTWLTDMYPAAFENGILYLKTVSPFKKNIIKERFTGLLRDAAIRTVGFDVEVEIITEEDAVFSQSEAAKNAVNYVVRTSSPTFDNFIVGSSNQFAYVAAVAVSNNPGTVHNPLFIYGNSGLGKTHLLKAIKAEISTQRPELNILYTSGENFFNEMLAHISEKKMSDFHNKYRNCDVLLVDDIQFISNKPVFQEEFFYTFDALMSQNKQIVLASDRPPKDISSLEERLKTRFCQGLLADIQPPMLETRIAIIREKSQVLGLQLSKDVIEFIAERLKNNVRQIEGVVNKIYAVCSLDGKTPTIGVANDIIKDVIIFQKPTEVIINNIIEQVAKAFGVSPDDVCSEKKKADVSNARQFAMYIMREVTNLTFEEIGDQFNGKKHSTVIYSIEAAERKMDEKPSLKQIVDDILKNIRYDSD